MGRRLGEWQNFDHRLSHCVRQDRGRILSSTVPLVLAESQPIAGKCWPKVAGFFAYQAGRLVRFLGFGRVQLGEYLVKIVPRVTAQERQERVTEGRWRRTQLGDFLAKPVVELRGRARVWP